MEDGLHIVCCPGGYYPYVRIGWCRRVDGWIVMYGARVLKKFGNLAELAEMADTGPKESTQILKAAKKKESTSVALVARAIECDEAAWKAACPRPKSYG